ncbi:MULTISPECIES: hypothetical protein [Fusobacterium]|jgi:hypothetical protein|uniref:hypothetical protein n=1 Tax=Fusobacterium TaxID=848 RepID=UPI00044DA3FF|nr:hypothetical protein [Fusobacterium sp. CM22]EUB16985.1 hypothetical protein HMPREF1500_1119 [Fusobacterium sp. CM22]
MEKESKEINIKIEKFEKVKEFRDLNSLRLINKDNSTISLNEKFKDFQEIYTLITSYIKTNNKKWLFSKKDEVYYIFSQNRLATSTVSTGNIDEDILKIKKISEDFDFISPEYINFDIPDEKQLRELRNVNFLEDGYWYYKYNKNDGTIVYSYLDFAGLGTKKNKGIFNIESFIDSLDTRNQSLKVETKITKEFDKKIEENGIEISEFTDLSKFIETLTEIGVFNKVKVENLLEKMKKRPWWRFWGELNPPTPKELLDRYKATLLESKELKDFEVILNYNLLDTDIIKGEDSPRKFRNLVNLYKTYKKYISCIYIKDNTEDTVELIFDYSKIISSAEDRNELFDGIEILYKDNNLGIEKEKIYNNRNIIYYKNGDIEEIYNPKSDSKISIYYYKNGDYEKRNYLNGILEGESLYKFLNGDSETREYKNGILEGIVIVKKGEKAKQYFYNNGNMEEMPILKKYLSIDKERINIDNYEENRLTDYNLGHWDLENDDKEELEKILGKSVYDRDPKKDINNGGIVGIDFGTKSTVVVYQKDRTTIMPMRISGGAILNNEIRDEDYENPTVIEFIDKINFLKDYNTKKGRPDTKWEDVTVSYTASNNLSKGNGEQFYSTISDIKQWTIRNEGIDLKDKKGNKFKLPIYSKLDENKDKEDFLDPVELYAYYIGSYINTMKNGIYLEYYLSFPVTYEIAVREKILNSFKRGIKKSLPIQIQADEKIMKKFKVEHGSNEPAAYAICALKTFKIDPKDEEDKIYYGVFDFGGGTTDFDFGIWKLGKDEEGYDYELEHFGAGGDINLGGENIVKELAYRVFTNNSSKIRQKKMSYTRPLNYPELREEDGLIDNESIIARLNTKLLAEKLREVWEDTEKNNRERIDVIKLRLYDKNNEIINDLELSVNEDELNKLIKEKIETGIKNFFIKLEEAFKDEEAKEINIFLAGNSSKHPYVEEIFKRYQEEMKDKFILNIYDAKAIKEANKESTKVSPTAKTGVAYGLIYSRKGGKIKVTNVDEKRNIGNEINFKYYVGNSKRDKFVPVITPSSKYEEYNFFGIVTSDTFEIYYTTSPEAQTRQMEVEKAIVKRIALKNEYNEDERYRVYIKANANQPTTIHYVMVKNEEDVETKEFLEEDDISLD